MGREDGNRITVLTDSGLFIRGCGSPTPSPRRSSLRRWRRRFGERHHGRRRAGLKCHELVAQVAAGPDEPDTVHVRAADAKPDHVRRQAPGALLGRQVLCALRQPVQRRVGVDPLLVERQPDRRSRRRGEHPASKAVARHVQRRRVGEVVRVGHGEAAVGRRVRGAEEAGVVVTDEAVRLPEHHVPAAPTARP